MLCEAVTGFGVRARREAVARSGIRMRPDVITGSGICVRRGTSMRAEVDGGRGIDLRCVVAGCPWFGRGGLKLFGRRLRFFGGRLTPSAGPWAS